MNALSAKKKEQIFSLLLAAAGHITSRWNVGCWRTLLSALRVFLPSFWSAHSPSNRRDLTPAAAASQLRERGNFSIIFNRVCVCVCVCVTCKRLFISTAAPRPSQKKRLEHKTIFIYTHTQADTVFLLLLSAFLRGCHSHSLYSLTLWFFFLFFLFFFSLWSHDWLTDRHQTVKDKTRGGPWQFYIAAEFSGCSLVSPWNRKVKI